MTLIDSSSLTAQDIGTPLLVCTYTADADRELSLSIGASGLAGGGTYRACLTKQIGGAGAVYQSPTTAIALAPTVTTCWLPSMPIAVQDGDVVRVYLQGLAADTAVGVVTEVYDTQAELATATAALILATPANKLETDASGRVEVSGTKNTLDDLPTADDIADATLKRDWTSVSGEAARSVLNALRFLRNKWSISGTTLTVTKENDTDTAWQGELSTSESADSVIGVDPG